MKHFLVSCIYAIPPAIGAVIFTVWLWSWFADGHPARWVALIAWLAVGYLLGDDTRERIHRADKVSLDRTLETLVQHLPADHRQQFDLIAANLANKALGKR